MARKDRIIGDKRTNGSRNIPLFWNSSRYTNENIMHCVASILFLLAGVVTILFIVLANLRGFTPDPNNPKSKGSITLMVCGILLFMFLFAATILKINERKIRKARISELDSSEGRTITVL